MTRNTHKGLDFAPKTSIEDTRDDPKDNVMTRPYEGLSPDERWPSRDARRREEKVQMSVRCNRSVYDRFRQICEQERYSNGDMIERMMNHYVKTDGAKS